MNHDSPAVGQPATRHIFPSSGEHAGRRFGGSWGRPTMNEATWSRSGVLAPVKERRSGDDARPVPAQRRTRAGLYEKGSAEAVVRTQGEIEAAVSDAITCFEQQYMARGPGTSART